MLVILAAIHHSVGAKRINLSTHHLLFHTFRVKQPKLHIHWGKHAKCTRCSFPLMCKTRVRPALSSLLFFILGRADFCALLLAMYSCISCELSTTTFRSIPLFLHNSSQSSKVIKIWRFVSEIFDGFRSRSAFQREKWSNALNLWKTLDQQIFSNPSRKRYYSSLPRAVTCIYFYFLIYHLHKKTRDFQMKGITQSNERQTQTRTEPYEWAHLSCYASRLSSHRQHSSGLRFRGFIEWPGLAWYVCGVRRSFTSSTSLL